MRKATLSVFIVMLCLLGVSFSAKAQYVLTYTDGSIVKGSGASYGEETHVLSAAIYMDAAKLAPVKGKNITKISVGLVKISSYPTTVYNDLTVWVKRNLADAEPLASTILPKDKIRLNNWNEVALETPFAIPDGALYIGYTIEANRIPIAYDGNTDLMNLNATHQEEDGTWLTNQKLGNLCIKAYVEEETPSYNVTLMKVVAPETIRTGTPFHIIGNVINRTSANVESLTAVCKVGDEVIATSTVTNLELTYDGATAVDFSGLTTDKIADNMKVSVQITEINGQPDVDESDNSASTSFSSKADNGVQKKFLLEQFTSLPCGGCPAGTAALKSAIRGYEDQSVWVANHNGAYTDDYTIPESDYFASFYGVDMHAAPSVMFDRVNFSDLGATVATQGGSIASVGPVFAVQSEELVRNIVLLRSCEYTPVELAITQAYSGAGLLDVTVKGKTSFKLGGVPAVSLFLTEDSLFGGTHGNQDNVIRYVANSADRYCLGDPLEIDNNGNFETSYTIDLKSLAAEWNLSNVNIVAFVSNLDGGSADAINNNKVYNAEKVKLYDDGSGIDANIVDNKSIRVYAQEGKVVVEGEATSFDVYTIDGKMIANDNLPKGIYLVKVMNGKQTKTEKIQL